MLKILHTADIHLDSPLKSLALRDPELAEAAATATRSAFRRIIDTAIEERVAAILIAGDLFDGQQRSARTGAFLIGELDRLRNHGVRVFYIKGNHDAENPVTGTIDFPDNVHVFDGRGGKVRLTDDVWIHGVSFAQRHAPESLLPRFEPPVPGAINIGLLHTSLAGAKGHDVYAPCTAAELAAHGFDYWALGHVHARQIHVQTPCIVMPGTPQGRDIGEAGPKSATLIEIGGGISIREVPTSILEFMPVDVSVSEGDSDEELRARIREALQAAVQALVSDHGAIRLRLKGKSARRWQMLRDRDVWTETVSDIARETERLWLEQLVMEIESPRAAAEGGTAANELGRMMEDICKEAGFRAAACERVDEILAALPPELRRALATNEASRDSLVDQITRAGQERVLAHMRGGR
ncbi:MAG: DNA repair exonuclease [Gammaproteobacteria bacterium]|nr:MAG: DNA repair exonuclease [Gammaproteobacteria bacterium]